MLHETIFPLYASRQHSASILPSSWLLLLAESVYSSLHCPFNFCTASWRHSAVTGSLSTKNMSNSIAEGFSRKHCVGVCGPLPKTFTLFLTKIWDFPYQVFVWPDQEFDTLFVTWSLNRYPVSDLPYNISSLVQTLSCNKPNFILECKNHTQFCYCMSSWWFIAMITWTIHLIFGILLKHLHWDAMSLFFALSHLSCFSNPSHLSSFSIYWSQGFAISIRSQKSNQVKKATMSPCWLI